jgi:hypothetical protein
MSQVPPIPPQPQANYYPPPPEGKKTNGLGVASLILGILACIVGIIPICGMMGAVPLALIGGVLGIVGIIIAASSKRIGAGMPIAGIIVCVLSIGVATASSWLFTTFAGEMAEEVGAWAQAPAVAMEVLHRASNGDLDSVMLHCSRRTDREDMAQVIRTIKPLGAFQNAGLDNIKRGSGNWIIKGPATFANGQADTEFTFVRELDQVKVLDLKITPRASTSNPRPGIGGSSD